MFTYRKLVSIACVFTLLTLPVVSGFGAQHSKSFFATANGKGTLKVGQEEFTVSSVVVKLMEDGKAEITLISDITVFVSGKWSSRGEAQEGIDLEITGGATKGGLEGNGKLLLREDGKSIASLTALAEYKATKRKIELSFAAK